MASRERSRREVDDEGAGNGSERLCALTRAVRPPEELIRFVLAPDNCIVPDLERKLPGRGAWLTCQRDIVEKAIKTRALSRSFKADAKAPDDLPQRIEALLQRRVTDTLALANKAGLALSGFQKVESALEKGAVAALIHGSDAASDGCHKLDKKFRAIQGASDLLAEIVTVLTINEISLAMGRPSVVHAALIPGGLTERFLREVGRVVRYRTSSRAPDLAVAETLSPPANEKEG